MAINQQRTVAPVIRSAFNNTGSTILKGTIVKLNTSAPLYAGEIAKAAANSDVLYGVTMQDVLNGAWGDVQISGIAIVLVGTANAIGARLTSDANGKTITWATTQSLLGIAVTAGVVADVYQEVELAGPGGNAT
jgi:hypothetical protein